MTSAEPLPSSYTFGKVVGRVIHLIADTDEDTDDKPQARAAAGKVTFIPKEVLRKTTGPDYPAIVMHAKETTSLSSSGRVLDAEGRNGIWLAVGVYAVKFDINGAGSAIPSFDIQVTAEHNDDTPLDLASVVPYVPPTGTVVQTLVVPSGGTEGQTLVRTANGNLIWADPVASGGIESVNGLTGAVVLGPEDIGAAPAPAGEPIFYRGVNVAGLEFGDARTGVFGTDYFAPDAEFYPFLADRGHTLVRLPFKWERVQPALGTDLVAAEVQRLRDALDAAEAEGLKVVLDLHNYARYTFADGTTHYLGSERLPLDSMNDVWLKLVAALGTHPAIHSLGLMNEPDDMPTVVVPAPPEDYAAYTAAGGAPTLTVVDDGGDALQMTMTAASGTYAALSTPTGVTPGEEVTVRGEFKMLDTSDNLQLSVLFYDANGTELGGNTAYEFGSSNSWKQATTTATAPANATTYKVRFTAQGNAIGQRTRIRNISGGGGSLSGRQAWEQASAATVTVLRSAGYTGWLAVGAYNHSGAQSIAGEHTGGWWVNDPLNKTLLEVHYYPDPSNGGIFDITYASAETDAVGRGYANLAARVTAEITTAVDWAVSAGVPVLLGEVGWPHSLNVVNDTPIGSAEAEQWNAIGEVIYDLADSAGWNVTGWATGPFPDTYESLIYTRTRGNTSMTPTVEAHPSPRDAGSYTTPADVRALIAEHFTAQTITGSTDTERLNSLIAALRALGLVV